MVKVSQSSDLVMVPVPVALYGDVVRLVAESLGAGARAVPPVAPRSGTDEPEPPAAPPVGQPGWSAADYVAIAPFLNRFSRAVLDLCSARAGEWVTYHDAVAVSGVASASARSQLGGLTKLVKRSLPAGSERGWPFEYDLTPGSDRQLRFRMSAEASRLWTAASQKEKHG